MTDRIKQAVQFLKDGQSFTVNEIRLGIKDNYVYVTGWTSFKQLSDLNKSSAAMELNKIKAEFDFFLNECKELKDFVKGKIMKFNLAFDYGMGSIGICSEVNNIIIWESTIKD